MSDTNTTLDHSPATPTVMPRRTSQTKAKKQSGLRSIALRALFGLTLMAAVTTSVGCFVPIYSARPERRVQQMLYTSEDLRALVDEWERFWFLDSPSHLTPIRTHGGIF
ncbi:hypothetical protein [Neorhodopirellula lusitana]|uniref:hypothetical protein n=1 Tax=Neorhodopirellula lusitana TaxID=445327 RepID=UPI00384E62AE